MPIVFRNNRCYWCGLSISLDDFYIISFGGNWYPIEKECVRRRTWEKFETAGATVH